MKFRLIESIDDELVYLDQDITSKATAHGNGAANNGQGRVPALFSKINYNAGDVILDYGCGEHSTSNKIKEYLGDVIYCGYDKYNRTPEENTEAINTIKEHSGADVATCANVLNVIKDRDIRVNEVIRNIYTLLKQGGIAYFDVYEDAKKEGPKQTGKDKWQEFRPLSSYVDEVEEVFGKGNVTVKGKVLIARK